MPRLSVARPAARLPVPMASITLSPDPQATSVSGEKPNSVATSARTLPIGSNGAASRGKDRSSIPSGSISVVISVDHARDTTSK
ncbi:MAG: hypothetical protein WAN92_09470 [Herbaspirillum sp.]